MLYKMQMANKKKVVFKKTTLSKRVLTNTSILLIRGQIFLEVIIVLVKLQENGHSQLMHVNRNVN